MWKDVPVVLTVATMRVPSQAAHDASRTRSATLDRPRSTWRNPAREGCATGSGL
jgi:hypothetical protein